MKLRLIADCGGFTSTALLPTILVGKRWAYIYWFRGRLGIAWS